MTTTPKAPLARIEEAKAPILSGAERQALVRALALVLYEAEERTAKLQNLRRVGR